MEYGSTPYVGMVMEKNGVPIQCVQKYGSTPYVGMVMEKNGVPIQCVQNDMFRTLL